MRRRLLPAVLAAGVPLLVVVPGPVASPGRAATPGDTLLAAPLDTSLPGAAPPAAQGGMAGGMSGGMAGGAAGGLIAGGEASTVFGSNGLHGGAVQLDSGLIGGTTRASVAFSAVQGPRWHGAPVVGGDGAALGIETALPHGFTVELGAGYAHDRFRLPGDAAVAAGPGRPGP